MARIEALCVSARKGTAKTACVSVEVLPNHGIVGDAHAGDWHRQVSILPLEDIEAFNAKGASVRSGDFGENVIVSGIDFAVLAVGDILRCNGVTLELSQFGKECHTRCAIFERMGDCIMPRHGVFAKVIVGGRLRTGDSVTIECLARQG